ncbi:hypothetical protein [Marinitoga aeolica]|uniref:Outer membrane protein beta-barrel domain-containing protein n=1 Tax=Marinitoga aeolica TaxID=2809031 RepID=A0ABY8PNB7_9BACT|nr:hypothetical protein [Marinitoga aeolica]WGS64132.1 hypothetical protein JRV97_07045 [Marinitoga aeolica]
MKKVILMIVLVLSITMFSINFGGGGYLFNYIPKDQVSQINPLKKYINFDEIILHGGGGMGIMPNGSYMGGEGYSGEVINGDYKLVVSQGYFTFGKHINIFKVLGLNIGMGIGGGETIISKKVEGSRSSKKIDDFVNNVDSVPYVIQLKRDELSVSPKASLYFNIMDFVSLFVEGRFTYNYSPENWKIEGEYTVTDNIPNYDYYYSFGAGIMWGF